MDPRKENSIFERKKKKVKKEECRRQPDNFQN